MSSHQALTDTKTMHKQIWDGQMTEIHLWKKMFMYRDYFIIEVPTQQVQHVSCRISEHTFTQCSALTLHWVNESGACIIVLNNDKWIDGYDQYNFKNADGDDDHIANYIYIFFQIKNKCIKMRIICLPTSPSLKAVKATKWEDRTKLVKNKQSNSSLCQMHLTRNVSSAGPML